ncbi:helix-turn-helix domain-containing protein [Selenomonas ruminantium]|uniref:helix-turn-helix domain-containing protein n=1 Tax=Selenomonas ruminantium TaxID=971 RepID=UPI00047EC3F2|nr:helix-turn-helix transcriptional regulator [Selenomonas ruminantium]
MTLGEVVKAYRVERKLSMDNFAKLSGLSKGYISMLEKNRNPRTGKPIVPSIDTYTGVAKAMNMSIEDLMRLVGSEQLVSIAPTAKDDVDDIFDEDIRMLARNKMKDASPEEREKKKKQLRTIIEAMFE